MPDLFSVPIFIIVFRETLEAAIIVSVLLGLVEQIIHESKEEHAERSESDSGDEKLESPTDSVDHLVSKKALMRKMRIQIFAGTAVGLLIAIAIGAAFIAVWFTKATSLWAQSEALWEGIFELIASIMIFIMGVTMLKMDRAKAKWRVKLTKAFSGKHVDGETSSGKWILFILPLITVLREGLEAVVFVGGVSLGQAATSIPIAAIVGLICGFIVGYIIYKFASRAQLSIFLITMTSLLLLIGGGLFTRAVAAFLEHRFNQLLGGDIDDVAGAGNGPGSYDVRGVVWHLDCCNPEQNDGNGWSVFNALFGWNNTATVGSILAYVFWWLTVIVALIYQKWKEGRTKIGPWESAAGKRRREYREKRLIDAHSASTPAPAPATTAEAEARPVTPAPAIAEATEKSSS